MSEIKTFKIYDELFKININVYLNASEKLGDEYKDVSGATTIEQNSCKIYLGNKKDKFNIKKTEDQAILLHEIEHAFNLIYADRNHDDMISFDKNCEWIAYYKEWLCNKISNKLNK